MIDLNQFVTKDVREIILKLKDGILLTIKMPVDVNDETIKQQIKEKKAPGKKVECQYCHKPMTKTYLKKHMLNCTSKPEEESNKPQLELS